MSDQELAIYYYQQATHLSHVATWLLLVAGVLVILLIVATAVAIDAIQARDRVQEALAQQNDPTYHLALIRQLGEAGRHEVRRLAHEAQHVMLRTGEQR
jgi:hypothetical protein